MQNIPTLDARSYIEAFGGRLQLVNKIRKRFAVQLTKKQVDKWVERNSIPGAYLVVMQVIGAETSPEIDLFNYLK